MDKNKSEEKMKRYSLKMIFACIWLALVIISGIYMHELKGIYGPFMQLGVAFLLLLIGCYDLASVKTNIERFKGFGIMVIAIIYAIPAVANVIPNWNI